MTTPTRTNRPHLPNWISHPARPAGWIVLVLLAALALTVQGCGIGAAAATDAPFRPPTPQPTQPPPAASAVPQPSATVPQSQDCTDVLSYVSDLTIPDGTEVQPGSSMDKRWQIRNNGTCNWQEGYHLRLIGGPDLGANPEQALMPVRSGQAGVIRIQFTAPTDSGNFRSAWQAFNQDDEAFGDPVFIDINVSP